MESSLFAFIAAPGRSAPTLSVANNCIVSRNNVPRRLGMIQASSVPVLPKSERKKVKLLIDTDAGVDDAQALMLALSHPDAEVKAITCVAGNVGVDKVVTNVAHTLDACGVDDIPFYRGADVPHVGLDPLEATYYHGEDGLGDAQFPPPSRALPLGPAHGGEHAASALVRFVNKYPHELTVVALGPLTNIAMACRLDPHFPRKVANFVFMGGTVDARGNITSCTEFNIRADPEAAYVTLHGFEQSVMVPWETTVKHGLDWEWFDKWQAVPTQEGKFVRAISRKSAKWCRAHGQGWVVCDALAVLVAIQPETVVDSSCEFVTVELGGFQTRGMTVVDWAERTSRRERGNVHIITKIDMDEYKRRMFACVRPEKVTPGSKPSASKAA